MSEMMKSFTTVELPSVFMDNLPKVDSSYYDLSMEDLKSSLRPNYTDVMFSVSFWKSYRKRMVSGRGGRLNLSSMCKGMCSSGTMMSSVKENPNMLVYYLRSHTEVEVEFESLSSEYGFPKLREMLESSAELPLYVGGKEAGIKVDVSLLSLQFDVVRELIDSSFGPVVKRHEMKQETKSLSSEFPDSLEEMNKSLEKLDSALSSKGTMEYVTDAKYSEVE